MRLLLLVLLGMSLGAALVAPVHALSQSNATNPIFIPAPVQPEKPVVEPEPWVEMPEGARKAYIGIHGGTVPVSLLSAGDGTPLIAQVGLTGSDFLNFMRSRGKESPWGIADLATGGVDTMGEHTIQLPVSSTNATFLLAGTAVGDVPVIYATGREFERMAIVPANWAPFGLTEKPLSMEGAVKLPPRPEKRPARNRR